MLTREQLQDVIHAVADGEALKDALRSRAINRHVYTAALNKHPDLLALKYLSEKTKAEILADEILEIADIEPDPFRARNRIDARKWLASKLYSERFGDKLDVNVTSVSITAALDEARSRALRSMGDQATITDAQVIETQAISSNTSTDSKSVVEAPPAESAVKSAEKARE